MSLIKKGHTMIHESDWHTCKICQMNIKELAKKYGGNGVYYSSVFTKHLEIDHQLTLEEYFADIIPICCDECKKPMKINKKLKLYRACGRSPGQKKWSEEAEATRCGENNPMFGKKPWNLGLDVTHPTIKIISEKMSNREIGIDTKNKMSISAKARTIHGHTGCKHSEETKAILRTKTIQNIKDGKFKQTKTKPHIAMQSILDDLKIVYNEEYRIDCWLFDFYLVDLNILIEVDGDYFHSNPKIYPNGPMTKTQKINHYRDLKKNSFVKQNDLTLYRYWESDILNNGDNIKCILKKLSESKK